MLPNRAKEILFHFGFVFFLSRFLLILVHIALGLATSK